MTTLVQLILAALFSLLFGEPAAPSVTEPRTPTLPSVTFNPCVAAPVRAPVSGQASHGHAPLIDASASSLDAGDSMFAQP